MEGCLLSQTHLKSVMDTITATAERDTSHHTAGMSTNESSVIPLLIVVDIRFQLQLLELKLKKFQPKKHNQYILTEHPTVAGTVTRLGGIC